MIEINLRAKRLGEKRSAIRELFEYGIRRAAEIGAENVYDYSLGNPSTPPPEAFNEAIKDIITNMDQIAVHGYTPAAGSMEVRKAYADDINKRFNAGVLPEDIYITCGAAASLTIALHALFSKNDEVITMAPFFPEYRVFAENAGYRLVTVKPDFTDFQPDIYEFEKAINENTKAVIINSPNNPTGVVMRPEKLRELTELLKKKEREYAHPIFLISDEPYRELVYDDIEVPYLINEYNDTIVCYSFSKSLSIPGDRIGYIVVSNKMQNHKEVFNAVAGAGRALGYVCAPALLQHATKRCLGMTSDIESYRENRDILYKALTEYGFQCIYPDGAFYMFMKSPIGDAERFSKLARQHELLIVPSDSFGLPGYIRLSYCVSKDMILRSLPAFKKLAEETCGSKH